MEKKIKSIDRVAPPCIEHGVFLNKYNTFKVGGRADYFAKVSKINDLIEVADYIKKNKLNFFILGAGSNTLFSDNGFKGVVIKTNFKGKNILSESSKKVLLSVGSGESWDKLVDFCLKKGFHGFENLTSIPGSVGGAIVQNIGAYGVEIKDKVYEVQVMDIRNGSLKKIKGNDLGFDYRHSIFKKKSHSHYIIISVVFQLSKNIKTVINYKDLREHFDKKNIAISHREVRNALKKIRSKKFPNLKKIGTAGSFFKNVVLNKKDAKVFLKKFPDAPSFPFEKRIKIPTGYILDKICNLKGYREGNVGLFEKQSLVLVNFGNATAKEIFDFKNKIKKIVFDKTGIKIKEEVVII